MKKSSPKVDRRDVIKRRELIKLGAAGIVIPVGVYSSQSSDAQSVSANERIQVGVIGLGARGYNLIDGFLANDQARITAVCDVDHLHYRDRAWGKGPSYGLNPAAQKIASSQGNQADLLKTSDFRRLCESEKVDAVVVATPDHWHAHCTLEAIKQGKDVYCEKPVTHTFAEGQMICKAVKDAGTVFQTGSQQRSDEKFRRAVELVRNGHLGEIKTIEVGLPPGYDSPQGDDTPVSPPVFLDYEFWVGPAPFFPYMRARHHRWWRGHTAYGGGVLMDWIGHHNDIAHWALALDRSGPTRVQSLGWTFPETSIYNTPHQYEILCQYENGTQTSISSKHRQGVTFRGEKGNLFVTRGKIQATDERLVESSFLPGLNRVIESNDHIQNFIDCIRTREECIAPAEVAHRSITPGHLGYVSWQLRRPIEWDPQSESIRNDAEADQLLWRNDYREPWT
ncbi:MAG: Gfo/Idh/MocA family protein [Rubripirellula sp.]